MRIPGYLRTWYTHVLSRAALLTRRTGRIWSWLVPDRKSLLLLIVFLIVSWAVARELQRDIVFIQPLALPKELKEYGYSEEVAAYRLRDAVIKIEEDAKKISEDASRQSGEGSAQVIESVTLLPSSERVSFAVPGVELTFDAILNMVRFFSGMEEQRIAGEFVCQNGNCKDRHQIQLSLRVIQRNGHIRLIDLEAMGDDEIDAYFHKAARRVAEVLKPYTAAIFEYTREDLRETERIAMSIVNPTNPYRAFGFNALGLVATKERRYSDAENYYEKALSSKPVRAHAQVYTNWGVALRKQNDYDGEIDKYQAALRVDDSYADAYNSWGFALRRKGDLSGAEDKYSQAIAVDPEYALAYYNRAVLKRIRCNLDGAIQDYESAIEIDQQYHFAYSGLAVALRRRNFDSKDPQVYARIDALYDIANKLKPDSKVTLMNWGASLIDAGDMKRSREKLDSALALDRDYDRAHFHIGRIYEQGGELEMAFAAYEKAITRTLKDDDDRRTIADVHEARARVLRQLRRVSEADSEEQMAKNLRAEAKVTPECG